MMDKIDRKLLTQIQVNNRRTSEDLAQELGTSPASVQRRLKRLRESGVVEADVSLLCPKAVDRELLLLVQVTLERERVELIAEFEKQMQKLPEVQQCYYVTGDHDYVLLVTAKSMEEYERFTQENFFANANMRRFHTTVVMRRVKVGLSLPV
ncbi:MAG: Lrp/AsnC family transcriptional regulator [Pseudomonadota bacterium]